MVLIGALSWGFVYAGVPCSISRFDLMTVCNENPLMGRFYGEWTMAWICLGNCGLVHISARWLETFCLFMRVLVVLNGRWTSSELGTVWTAIPFVSGKTGTVNGKTIQKHSNYGWKMIMLVWSFFVKPVGLGTKTLTWLRHFEKNGLRVFDLKCEFDCWEELENWRYYGWFVARSAVLLKYDYFHSSAMQYHKRL